MQGSELHPQDCEKNITHKLNSALSHISAVIVRFLAINIFFFFLVGGRASDIQATSNSVVQDNPKHLNFLPPPLKY